MSNITTKVAQIRQAVYGKDVRENIASGIEAINTEVESTTARQNVIDAQEQTRINAENTRISNENTRKSNETARQSAETTRQTTFTTNENARESTFDSNESARQSDFDNAEDNRQNTFDTNETARQGTFNTNETIRNQAEIIRIANEEYRETTFDAMIHADPALEVVQARGGNAVLNDRFIEIETDITNINTTVGNAVSFVSNPGGDPIQEITEYNFIDHINALETEVQGARNGETSIDGRFDKIDLSLIERVKKSLVAVTYYVNVSTGSDSNDGLTSGTAFKTIQYAINSLPQIINHIININLASGTYNEDIVIQGLYGSGQLLINGDTVVSDGYIITSISIFNCCLYTVKITGIKCTGTNAFVTRQCGGMIEFNYCKSDSIGGTAFYIANASACNITNSLISNKTSYGIYCTGVGSNTYSSNNTGTGNNIGLYANAGKICKMGTQPSGIAAEGTGSGGLIIPYILPTEFTLTGMNGFAGIAGSKTTYFKTQEGVVVVNGFLQKLAGQTGAATIATLPVGYRPDTAIRVPAVFNIANRSGSVLIYPGGNIDVESVDATSYTEVRFTDSFVARN